MTILNGTRRFRSRLAQPFFHMGDIPQRIARNLRLIATNMM